MNIREMCVVQRVMVGIYEGHDVPKASGNLIPKNIDQPMINPSGSLTQNGLFYETAQKYKACSRQPELVRVYEKIHRGKAPRVNLSL